MPKSEMDGYDRVYCYSNSYILKNKFSIKNHNDLEKMERKLTSLRNVELQKNPRTGKLDFEHLKKIHQYIFQDLYEWAGKERSVNIAKNELFCTVPCINDMSLDIFNKLKKDKYLMGLEKESFSSKLSYYFGELNALHPFREGNGRAQREFLRTLSLVAGYELNLKNISKDEMMQASIDTFNCDYNKMEDLINGSIQTLTYEKQKQECEKILVPGSEAYKIYKEFYRYLDEIKKEIVISGYHPSEKILKSIVYLNRSVGKKNNIRDINEIYVNKSTKGKEGKYIDIIAGEFKEQKKEKKLCNDREI